MKHLKASETTLFFNKRDEMIKVKLGRMAYYEAASFIATTDFWDGLHRIFFCHITRLCDNVSQKYIHHYLPDETRTKCRLRILDSRECTDNPDRYVFSKFRIHHVGVRRLMGTLHSKGLGREVVPSRYYHLLSNSEKKHVLDRFLRQMVDIDIISV